MEITNFYRIKEEIKKLNRIKYYNFELKIDFNKIKYKKPKNSQQECILKNKTYNIPVFIPISVKYKQTLILNFDFIKSKKEFSSKN